MLSVTSSPKSRLFPQERMRQQARENRVPVVGAGAPARRSAPLEMERQKSYAGNRFPARGSTSEDNSIEGRSKSFALTRSPTEENFRRHAMRKSATEDSLRRLQSGGGSPDNGFRSMPSARSPPIKMNKQGTNPAADSLKRAQSSRATRTGLVT
ncbi:hypothetical protein NDN08_002204 [Rhodosorus marinus]|uniref:Uncharacterized protein n=1 Tax=Rhodosorus marinus TaxID=101924 RepID=A0AAV8UT50_9RHOD|nr:hypothetical protein NDN08_002204 [Rhodosorus marinus]